jgi:uncharacterized protein (TIGR03382 family)
MSVGLGVSLGLGAIASADGTAMWQWSVVTNNGNAVVEPGESAYVTLSILTEPDQGAEFLALAASIFDTVGGTNADKGQIVTWEVLNDLDYLTGDLTTTDGVSLFNTNVGQLSVYGPFFTDNPLSVLTFQWKPTVQGTYTVDYDTNTEAMVMWEGIGDDAHAVWYDVVEGAISFNVVPAPGGAALAGLGGLVLLRRRRA